MMQSQQIGGMPPPPNPKKSEKGAGGLFKHKEQPMPDLSGMKLQINNTERRLRVLEEGFTNIRRSLQVTEQNMITRNKEFNTEIKALNSEFHELKKEIAQIKEKVLDLIRELESAAKIDEVKVLEKYINMWNPVKFVTQNEVERIIEEKLRNK